VPSLRLAGPVVFAAARQRYTTTVDLDCTPEALFDVFADADAWPVWVPPIESVTWTSPLPPGEGATRIVRMKGGVELAERFTAWDHGRHMQFVFTDFSRPGLDGFGEDYRVADLGDGRCRLRWTMALVPAPGAPAVLMGLTGWTTKPALNWLGRNLQRYVRDRVVTPA
jgi:hypothetical protein